MTATRSLFAGVVLALGVMSACPGCAARKPAESDAARDLPARVSERSAARLPQDAEAGRSVVIAVVHGEAPGPALPAGQTRSLAFVPGLALLEVDGDAVDALAAVPEGQRVVVWGTAEQVARMRSPLRTRMAELLADGRWDEARVDAVATFGDPDADLESELAERGIAVGSRNGGIVTLSSGPESLLDLLSHPDLVSLSAPADQQPSSWRTP